MTAPTDTRAPSSPACDPFAEGLPRPVVLRLLSGRFDREDLTAYYETAHFRRLREEVIETYGSCYLCSCRFRLRLTAHHRHYRTLFREDVFKDVSAICQGCHGKHHRTHGRRKLPNTDLEGGCAPAWGSEGKSTKVFRPCVWANNLPIGLVPLGSGRI